MKQKKVSGQKIILRISVYTAFLRKSPSICCFPQENRSDKWEIWNETFSHFVDNLRKH